MMLVYTFDQIKWRETVDESEQSMKELTCNPDWFYDSFVDSIVDVSIWISELAWTHWLPEQQERGKLMLPFMACSVSVGHQND